MAKAVFSTKNPGSLKSVVTSDFPISSIIEEEKQSKITDKSFRLSRLQDGAFKLISINDEVGQAQIQSILPFRIRLTNIGIEGYGPNNVPPIGIAIIGYNNYIL